jgi:hypothetical protein
MTKALKKPLLPPGNLIQDGQESAAPDELVAAVLAGWSAKQTADDAKTELDSCNASLVELMADIGPGAIVIPGVCRCTVVHREAVKITDPERLAKVLGVERYADLVKTSTSHKAEERLVEMAVDGDEPLQPAIAACLEIRESDAVTWRAEK